jgi:hypothetical protein
MMHQRVLITTFGNVVVLTEFASQIAARSAKAQHRRAGQKMVQRFFLNRINAKPTRAAIGIQYKLITLSFADKAQTPLAVFELAKPGTYFTNKARAVSGGRPISGGKRHEITCH